MPPKHFKPSKKAAGAAKKATGSLDNITETASLKVNETTQKGSDADNSSAPKKRRAESVDKNDENASKKPRQDEQVEKGESGSKQTEGPAGELDASIKKKFEEMRFILSDHTVRSMGALMDDIGYTGERPDDVEVMIDIIISQFEAKALNREDLAKDMAAFEKVDQNHWDGEYDSDPDGFDRDVRRRLNKAEDMVGRLTKQYLRDIIKQLHFYGRGGTNADLAAEIVAMLTSKASNGEDIKPEYQIVKGVYGMCYGCCGNDSSDAEGEDNDELDRW